MRLDQLRDITLLHRSPRIVVSRAVRAADGKALVLKALPRDQLHHHAIARLRYEHRVLVDLQAQGAAHVPEVVGFLEEPGTLALVLGDVGGASLRAHLTQGPLDCAEVLHIATQVAECLVHLHQARVIHKDINPNNVVVNRQSGAVQLIDFDLASLLPRELQSVDSLHTLEGTVPYVSPEQTGRLSRALDYRSDFFSLGVTLYELLAHTLPFEGEDLAEVVYAILAKAPRPWPEHVPEGLRAVVDRLLQKDPQLRYKSATGLLADLQVCAQAWQAQGAVALFDLGRADRSEQFDLPQRLYGRAAEVEALLQAYEAVTGSGSCGFVFMTGASGMGKSALVGEMQAALVRHHGLFAAGKYEYLRRHLPFSALSQALDALARTLLGEPAAALDKWRLRLKAAVGASGQALLDLAPSLELLVGRQQPLLSLGPQETENRLLSILQSFILSLSARQPLVLFLDDLQWADQGTLKWLLRLAASGYTGAGLLIVGAYRDNEVDEQHPVHGLLQALQGLGLSPRMVRVQPLSHDATCEMVQDATQAPPAEVQALATLLRSKTGGVPFFVHEFLRSLWTRGLVRFERARGAWSWDLAAVQAATVTENVAQLMSASLSALPAGPQGVLSLAACMGNEVALDTLVAASGLPRAAVLEALAKPLDLGLLVPVGGDYRYAADDTTGVRYRFAHDQIVQSAYELMAPDEAQARHAALGRLLMQQPGAEREPTAVVEQLNRALPLIQDAPERAQVARLNWLAGRSARYAAAYALATQYLQAGLRLLRDDWETQTPLLEALHLEQAHAYGMVGDMDAAERHLQSVEQHSLQVLRRVAVWRQRSQLLAVTRQAQASMQAGVEGLRLLGLRTGLKPSLGGILAAGWRLTRILWRRDLRQWAALPFEPSEWSVAREAMLRMTGESAVMFVNPVLFVHCMLMGVATVVGERVPGSEFISAWACVLAQLSRYGAARRWAALARQVSQLRPDGQQRARITFQETSFVTHLDLPPSTLTQTFALGVEQALEVGETLIAAQAASSQTIVQSLLSVEGCLQLIDHAPPVTLPSRQFHAQVHDGVRLLMCCLDGSSEHATLGPEYPAFAVRNQHSTLPKEAVRGTFSYSATQAALVHGAYPEAYLYAGQAVADGVFAVVSDHLVIPFCFFASLACVRHGKRPWWLWLARAKLRAAAKAGPSVYGGMPLLLEAEFAAARRRHVRAQQLFARANALLGQSGYTACMAVGLECAGRHAAGAGLHSAAQHLLQASRAAYEAWGAKRKVRLLSEEFGAYWVSASGTWRGSARGTSRGTSRGESAEVDLPAVIEASQDLAGEVDLPQLVRKALTALQKNAGATRCALLLRGDAGLQVMGDTEGEGRALPHTLIEHVARTEQPLVANEPSQWPANPDPYLMQAQPRALVCVPMMHQGRVLGVVYLENRHTSAAFAGDRLHVVQLLASQAAVAMESARLYSDLEAVVADRTEALRQAHVRLLQLERQSTEVQMAGGFAHEMRNALGGAALTVAALYEPLPEERGGYTLVELHRAYQAALRGALQASAGSAAALAQLDDSHGNLEAAAAQLDGSLQRALRITGQILDYAQVGSLIVGDDSVAAGSLVEEVLLQFAEAARAQHVQVAAHVPAGTQLPMKQEHAFAIVRNLVDNALDALRQQPEAARRLVVRVEEQGTEMTLSVQDSGPGVSEAAQKRMFEPFFTTKGVRGTGLGLGLCRKLSQAYGGTLTFETRPQQGSTFTVRVPRR